MYEKLSKLLGCVPNPFPDVQTSEQQNRLTNDKDLSFDDIGQIKPVYDLTIRPMNHLNVRLGEHWTIVGKSGSGKTRFAVGLMEYIRRQYPDIKRYVLDSTSDGISGAFNPVYVEGDIPPGIARDSSHTIVWQPDTDDLEAYDAWLMRILKKKEKCVVFLDETASLQTRSGEPIPGFIKILKQGRKHGITILNLSQETTKVPLSMFRQMTHYVQFRLLLGDTAEIVSARRLLAAGREHNLTPTNEHGFYYRNVPKSLPPVEYRNMQEYFSRSLSGGSNQLNKLKEGNTNG